MCLEAVSYLRLPDFRCDKIYADVSFSAADLNNLVVELSTTASNLIETLTGIVNGLLGQLNLGSLQSLNLGGLLGGASN